MRIAGTQLVRLIARIVFKDILHILDFLRRQNRQIMLRNEIKNRQPILGTILQNAEPCQQDTRLRMVRLIGQRIVDPVRRPLIIAQHEIAHSAIIHHARIHAFYLCQLSHRIDGVLILFLLHLLFHDLFQPGHLFFCGR